MATRCGVRFEEAGPDQICNLPEGHGGPHDQTTARIRPEALRNLFREAPTSITKVNYVARENGIRLYCEQAGATWNLQVRGPVRLANGHEGRDFIVATAHLTAEDLQALRDSIDELLGSDQ